MGHGSHGCHVTAPQLERVYPRWVLFNYPHAAYQSRREGSGFGGFWNSKCNTPTDTQRDLMAAAVQKRRHRHLNLDANFLWEASSHPQTRLCDPLFSSLHFSSLLSPLHCTTASLPTSQPPARRRTHRNSTPCVRHPAPSTAPRQVTGARLLNKEA